MRILEEAAENLNNKEPQVMPIMHYTHPMLREVSQPIVTDIGSNAPLQVLLNNMVATMTAYNGLGLAAVQVGVPVRCLVVRDAKTVYKVINPTVVDTDGDVMMKEGCLSAPGIMLNIRRPKEVVLEYYDENGDKKKTVANDWLGRAILHEIDHLQGVLFQDQLPKVRKQEFTNQVKQVDRNIKNLKKRQIKIRNKSDKLADAQVKLEEAGQSLSDSTKA